MTSAESSGSSFATKLSRGVFKDNTNDNLLFSPVAIQTCLALAYIGADGKPASDLQSSLKLNTSNKEEAAAKFSTIFDKTGNATFKNSNRIFVDVRFQISPEFNKIATKYFKSTAENAKFEDSTDAALQINTWFESETENIVRGLINPNSLDGNSMVVLVNMIDFHVRWSKPFDAQNTKKTEFSMSKTQNKTVDMMFQTDTFLYGEFKDLNAAAVEIKNEGTDITMLIVLPHHVDGLAAMEEKWKNMDIIQMPAQMKKETLRLGLPKFKIEHDLSLQPALEAMGLRSMFSADADFNGLLLEKASIRISDVLHKAFIEINEKGAQPENAADTPALKPSEKDVVHEFIADHPFAFAYKDTETVYLLGHVAKFK